MSLKLVAITPYTWSETCIGVLLSNKWRNKGGAKEEMEMTQEIEKDTNRAIKEKRCKENLELQRY